MPMERPGWRGQPALFETGMPMDMLKRLHEHISAMLDGELSGHEAELALAALGEPEGRAAWLGYQAIGDLLRRDAAGAELSTGFHARLAARLDMELAPAAAAPAATAAAAVAIGPPAGTAADATGMPASPAMPAMPAGTPGSGRLDGGRADRGRAGGTALSGQSGQPPQSGQPVHATGAGAMGAAASPALAALPDAALPER